MNDRQLIRKPKEIQISFPNEVKTLSSIKVYTWCSEHFCSPVSMTKKSAKVNKKLFLFFFFSSPFMVLKLRI